MQQWLEIIKEAEEDKIISPKEASDLRDEYEFLKTASLKDITGKILTGIRTKANTIGQKTRGGIKSFMGNKNKTNAALMIMVGAGTAAEVGGALARPFKRRMQYRAMRKQLDRISPETSVKFNDEHIKQVYDSMSDLAPAVAHNPLVSAVLVRDNIMIPDNINYQTLKSLSEIQRNVAGRHDKAPGVAKIIRGKMVGAMLQDAAKSITTG